ncbi:MAG: helix-turn-helix domain-containing protein [Rhodobacteraceae bacterium]|jgi:hypothetical protein|nr:helix-turn-helix domain-containing protein [Paracoccaceae bacterium]MBL4558545.1 helix-turn-helix domain-containing protein [Paracoccaceae bacterium]HBG99592.1 hypothetical protein [Paracoccaceae bacterium]
MPSQSAQAEHDARPLAAIWPVHVRAFARFLPILRAQFGGDLDAMLVMLLVSVGTEHPDWPSALLESGPPRGRARPTNAASIAEASGIPRETVRRKLNALHARGWIERDAAGTWRPARSAADDLRPATQATLDYLQTVIGAAQNGTAD